MAVRTLLFKFQIVQLFWRVTTHHEKHTEVKMSSPGSPGGPGWPFGPRTVGPLAPLSPVSPVTCGIWSVDLLTGKQANNCTIAPLKTKDLQRIHHLWVLLFPCVLAALWVLEGLLLQPVQGSHCLLEGQEALEVQVFQVNQLCQIPASLN